MILWWGNVGVAQWIEHFSPKERVVGSTPTTDATFQQGMKLRLALLLHPAAYQFRKIVPTYDAKPLL